MSTDAKKHWDQVDWEARLDELCQEAASLEAQWKAKGKSAPARPVSADFIEAAELMESHVAKLRTFQEFQPHRSAGFSSSPPGSVCSTDAASFAGQSAQIATLTRERDQFKAEAERLHRENAKLRADMADFEA